MTLADWRPDKLLVPALLAGSATRWEDLDGCDRAWVVAVLTDDEEITAEDIAAMLECSLRTVRKMITGPEVALIRLYRREAETFARDRDMSMGEVARLSRELAEVTAERDRVKDQRDRMLAAALAERTGETFRCGCPKTRYNTYVAPSGKTSCREHRRQAVARHRQARRAETKTAPLGAGRGGSLVG